MQTHFSLAQLADPDTREADKILRACVHCGFCTATCPTYVLLGDELDGPRGRIYLMKDMLENSRPASAQVAKHIDRCLSCLSCMTTCPSGVHYMHLVDQARHRIETTFKRPLAERWLRGFLALVLPRPWLFRPALVAAWLTRPLAKVLPGRLGTLAALAPKRLPSPSTVDRPQVFPAEGARRKRVALLTGCAQQVVAPQINEATVRLLTRHGCEVVVARGAGCCGGLTHHMGRDSLSFAKANIDAWTREVAAGGLDAIAINTSGCGVTIKDYGYMLRSDGAYAKKAAQVSALAKDVSELMTELGLDAPTVRRRRCSPRPASPWSSRRKRISAAAPPAPTTCCSRKSPGSCATARWRISRARILRSSPPAMSAASPRSPRAPTCPWCIRSSCSIGRPADKCQRRWRGT